MGESDMPSNADNDVEQENEKYPKRGTEKARKSRGERGSNPSEIREGFLEEELLVLHLER